MEKDKNHIHVGSDHGDSKHRRTFHVGVQSPFAAPTVQGSTSFDSEDETTAASTPTAPLKRGKKSQKQLAAGVATSKSQSTNGPQEAALESHAPRLTVDEMERQRAINRETERNSKAAAALDNRGNEYFERGHYDKAMDAYSRALKLKRRTFHSMMEEADDLFDEVEENKKIDSNDKELDPKLLVSMATSINNIGYLRQRAGEATPDETMAAYKKSLRIKRKILGSDSLSVGKTLNNIGSVYYLKKEFSDAMPAYDEALTIMQANLGVDHPDVATVISNMGDVNLALKKKNEALDHYRLALDIRWNAFGEKDPRTMRLLEKIARIEIGDQMPTPRGSKVERQYYDWDESELYDLDLRPLSHELRLLKDQVKEDIEAVNLLEKKLAVAMTRDKVKIVRGMRELIEAQDQNLGLIGGLEGSLSFECSQRGEGSNHDYDDLLNSPGMLPAMTENRNDGRTEVSPKSRNDAQARVQERLAKLRIQKGLDPAGPLSLPLIEHVSSTDMIKETTITKSVDTPSSLVVISTDQQLAQPGPLGIEEQDGDMEGGLRLRTIIEQLPSHGDALTVDTNPVGTSIASSVKTANGYERDAVLNGNEVNDRSEMAVNPSHGACEQQEEPTTCKNVEEVTSFFQDLMMEGPTRRPSFSQRSQRKMAHATWLGAVPVESVPHEPDTSMDDSVERAMSSLRSTPKLMHTTWLGEIES